MEKTEKLLSSNHERLLSIATWSKYLAWVVLVIFLCWAIAAYLQRQVIFMSVGGSTPKLVDFFKEYPAYAFSLIVEMIGIFLKGVVYFLVLKGLSLGLNMIVETDINYREQKSVQNEQ